MRRPPYGKPMSLGIIGSFLLCVGASARSDEPSPPGALDCPYHWNHVERVGTLENREIDESSGLAESWHHPEVLWTHNDSGDSARLFLLRKDGTHIAEVVLENTQAVDFEDMAIGPCAPDNQQPCVYVGDIGDNRRNRPHVVIHRFPEPVVNPATPTDPILIPAAEIRSVPFTYPDGPRDAEALMVHPLSARVYVVEKSGDGPESSVYRIPIQWEEGVDPTTAGQGEPQTVEAELLEVVYTPSILSYGRMITAGDISPAGDSFTLRTYTHLYTYCAPSPDRFEEAFGEEPLVVISPPTIQGEALTYDRTKKALWLTSEMLPAPLFLYSANEPETGPGEEPEDPGDPDALPGENAGNGEEELNTGDGEGDTDIPGGDPPPSPDGSLDPNQEKDTQLNRSNPLEENVVGPAKQSGCACANTTLGTMNMAFGWPMLLLIWPWGKMRCQKGRQRS